MANVLIIYTSMFGNTQKLAKSIADGAKSVTGTTVILRAADEATLDDVRSCDALILGSPVHMGMMDWRIKKFIDSHVYQLWLVDELVGKVAGVFATGGGYGNAGSGVELTQIAMLGSLAECGMILVPFPKSASGSEVTGSVGVPMRDQVVLGWNRLASPRKCSKVVVNMGLQWLVLRQHWRVRSFYLTEIMYQQEKP